MGVRRLVAGLAAVLTATACGAPAADVMLVQTSMTVPPAPAAPVPADPLTIGSAAVDTTGGWLPDGVTLSPFDTADPILSQVDPALITATQNAARAAQTAGVELRVTSGWRSKGFQQRLFDDAVRTYGSTAQAAQFVASPEMSRHVLGKAIDIGPPAADEWLLASGRQFGLCQIYANEIWHYELASDYGGSCPPLRADAAG